MATGSLFSFNAETETPADAARRRAIAEAIMGRSLSPSNVGEGFGAIASGIVANVQNNRASEAELSGRTGANDVFSRIVSGITGGAPGYTPGGAGSSVSATPTALDAANDMAAPDLSGSQQAFIEALMPTAIEVSQQTGVDPRIIVAQAALETGWGESAPGNNYFGIKSHGLPGGQTLNTSEFIDGEQVNVADSFRTYGSPQESVRGYGQFITENPRYSDFMAAEGLPAQLAALQASGYATDPDYASKVGQIARGIELPASDTMANNVMQSDGAPRTRVAQGPSLEELLMASQNPWLNDQQRTILNTMIETELAQQTPAAPDWQTQEIGGDLYRWNAADPNSQPQLFIDAPDEAGFVTLAPDEVAALGLPEGNYQRGPDGKISEIGGGGVNVTVGDGSPGLGKLSTDYGYVLDPVTGEPVIDPNTGLPQAAPVPGSPAALELERAANAREAQTEQSGRYGSVVLDDIGRVRDLVTNSPWYNPTTGLGGAIMQNVPASGAFDVGSLVDTIRANIGFDRLQQMRESSPTGGALGQVTERELNFLQSTLGNLDQAQSQEQFLYNLDRIGAIYAEIMRKASAYPNADEFGFGEAPDQSQADPEVVDFTEYFNQ